MPNCDVTIRLGSHAEKDYLIKTASLFRGVIVGGNLLEMTPGATVSLAWKFKTLMRDFSIDPLTYVFALDQSYISSEQRNRKTGQVTVEMKKAYQLMCKAFSGSFESAALHQQKPLEPADFSTTVAVEDLALSVLNYQLNRMKEICLADAQLVPFASEALPSFVFSPYFYIPGKKEGLSGEWQSVCLNALDAFGALKCPVPKHAVLCFSRALLRDRDRLLGILRRAIASRCDACWFWVSDFREEDVSDEEMINLSLMVKLAAQYSFPLYNLHGGFLSALLSKQGLYGFSHSIGYGESKDVFPVSAGALPTVSYHYNPLHVKASVPDIDRAFSTLGITNAQIFHELVCDCAICKGTLQDNIRNFAKFGELTLKKGNIRASQTAESAKRCRFHFLLARRKELDLVNGSTVAELLDKLQAVVVEYKALPAAIKLRDRSYPLSKWIGQL